MATSSHTLFCDETGNTGNRFLDPEQPIYAEGGWLIAHKYKAAAESAIVQIEQKFNFGATELKGFKLVKRSRGQAMLREICAAVGKNGGIPYAYVVEKRYAVCSKIIETFYDVVYNPMIPSADAWDPEKRQNDANFFYHQGGQLIEEFAEAYRKKDSAAVFSNANKWAILLRSRRHFEHAIKVQGVLARIEEEILTEARHEASEQTPRGMDSLNLPVISQVFQFVEQHCPYPCDIIHDEIASYEPVYKWVFEKFSNAKHAVVEMKDGRQLHTGFVNAVSLSFADSKKEPMIRAADYALAGTRKFIQFAIANEPIPADITHIAFATMGPILIKGLTLVHPTLGEFPELSKFMSSIAWCKVIFERLHHEVLKNKMLEVK